LERLLNRFLSYPEDIKRMQKKAALALPGRSTERAVEDLIQLASDLRMKQQIG